MTDSITFELPFKGESLTIQDLGPEGFYITRSRRQGPDVVIVDQVQGCLSHHVAQNIEEILRANRGEK